MYAIIIGWILELSEQRQVEFIGEVEASCGNLRQGRRLTSRNPFVTILSLGCVLRALSVLLTLFTVLLHSKTHLVSLQPRPIYFAIWAFMTSAAMFPTLQSYCTARIHYPNIRTFLLKTIVLLRLSAIAFVCEGNSSDLPIFSGCCNGLSVVDKPLREQMKTKSTHLICLERIF